MALTLQQLQAKKKAGNIGPKQLERLKNMKQNVATTTSSAKKPDAKKADNKKPGRTGLKKDLKGAKNLAEQFLNLSPLGRVDASRSNEVQNLLNQYQSQSDPFSASFAGKRSGDVNDFLSRYKDSTLGYDSNELTALREQRRRGIDRGFESGRAGLQRGQSFRMGDTQKSAQLAELAKSYGQNSADAENDIFIKSADEKQKRLEGYGTALQGAENTEYTKGQSALENYKNTLNTANADQLEREKINLGQEATDRAGQSAGIFGILGIQEARRNAKMQNKLIREGYRSNENIAGKNKQIAAPGQSYSDALNQLADELANSGGVE